MKRTEKDTPPFEESTSVVAVIPVAQRAVIALGYNEETRKTLATLADETKHITAITNADGREQAHTALMKLKNTRIAIERRGKAAREDATAFSKAVIAEEDALVNIISPEEERLQALRDEWDDRIENERKAKVAAEQKRQADIQGRIAAMRDTVNLALRAKTSANVSTLLADIQAAEIDADLFAEFKDTAGLVKSETVLELERIRDEFIQREQEAAKLAADRAELDRQRAEQEARDKVERDRVAAETAAANKKLAEERAAFEAEQAEVRRQQEAQHARIAAEQAAAQKVIDDQRRALEAAQQAERDAQAKRDREAAQAEEARKHEENRKLVEAALEQRRKDEAAEAERQRNYRPTFDEILAVLATHYNRDVDTVRSWVAEPKARKAA